MGMMKDLLQGVVTPTQKGDARQNPPGMAPGRLSTSARRQASPTAPAPPRPQTTRLPPRRRWSGTGGEGSGRAPRLRHSGRSTRRGRRHRAWTPPHQGSPTRGQRPPSVDPRIQASALDKPTTRAPGAGPSPARALVLTAWRRRRGSLTRRPNAAHTSTVVAQLQRRPQFRGGACTHARARPATGSPAPI